MTKADLIYYLKNLDDNAEICIVDEDGNDLSIRQVCPEHNFVTIFVK